MQNDKPCKGRKPAAAIPPIVPVVNAPPAPDPVPEPTAPLPIVRPAAKQSPEANQRFRTHFERRVRFTERYQAGFN